jgi:hypothetical protein
MNTICNKNMETLNTDTNHENSDMVVIAKYTKHDLDNMHLIESQVYFKLHDIFCSDIEIEQFDILKLLMMELSMGVEFYDRKNKYSDSMNDENFLVKLNDFLQQFEKKSVNIISKNRATINIHCNYMPLDEWWNEFTAVRKIVQEKTEEKLKHRNQIINNDHVCCLC